MTIHDESPSKPAPPPPDQEPSAERLFIHELGWRVSIKRGSEREFCYMMAPGQDYYHRLLDGELVVQRDVERLCMACAARRGIISHEMRLLPEEPPKLMIDPGATPILVVGVDDDE
jgi:hypothetical protein